MTKLTDTQALILSEAANRDGYIALPLPNSLRGGAAAKVVGAMLTKGFLEEVAADMRKGDGAAGVARGWQHRRRGQRCVARAGDRSVQGEEQPWRQ